MRVLRVGLTLSRLTLNRLSYCLALPVVVAVTTSCSSGDLSVGRRDAASNTGGAGGSTSAVLAKTNRASSIPIGIENVNNSPMKDGDYRALLRFVPDRTISIDRLYFGFNLHGASCWDPGGGSDGAGNGGRLKGSLTEISPATGLPTTIIATETVGACQRHAEAAAEVGGDPVLVWINASATLAGGAMYGLVISNDDAEPATNFFSFHMPIADTLLAGPHARNELSLEAAGGILSLDPREHVAWSSDRGSSWQYGSNNGQYLSYMNDHDTAHPATRMPEYGFRLTDGVNLPVQPYYAYRTDCQGCSVSYGAARYARSFVELGGFTASGTDVGTLAFTNLETGEYASCTPAEGYGFRTCALDAPVAVAKGQSYSISSTGSVEIMRMDNPQRILFPTVGTPDQDLCAHQAEPAPGTNAKDVPSLWAGPLSAQFPALDDR